VTGAGDGGADCLVITPERHRRVAVPDLEALLIVLALIGN
jgi:hypothetical protein